MSRIKGVLSFLKPSEIMKAFLDNAGKTRGMTQCAKKEIPAEVIEEVINMIKSGEIELAYDSTKGDNPDILEPPVVK